MQNKEPRFHSLIRRVYRELIIDRRKNQHFWILSTFIPTFVIARLLVHFTPSIFLDIRGTHVHHFTYGFIILAISGFLAVTSVRRSPAWLAALFGVGLALSVDEMGMWLHLTAYYYNETSENALIVVTALLINVVYFSNFWLHIIKVIGLWIKRSILRIDT